MDPWVVEVLREGYRIPFLCSPPLSDVPIPMPSYNPLSTKGVGLGEVTQALIAKGSVELAPLPSPGFYSRLFLVWKSLGVVETSHRSLDSQPLRGRVTFPDGDHPVCPPVCTSGRLDGLHQSLGGLPSGSSSSGISPLPSLCDKWPGLPVHSSVFWPLHGSAGFIPGHGSCFRHSPFLGYSHEVVPRRLASPVVLPRVSPPGPSCGAEPLSGTGHRHQPGEVQPSQVVQYLGVVLDAQSFVASPSPDRVARLRSTAGEFLSSADPPASIWLSLLGMLSSLSHLVPGGRLRMRSLQFCLHQSWDRVDQSTRIPWSQDCLRDLRWWLHLPRLSQRVSLSQVFPNLDFWSDASDVGWGAH